MSDPAFNRELRKRRKIALREIKDACLKCHNSPGLCFDCTQAAIDLTLTPKQKLEQHERERKSDAVPKLPRTT